MVALSHLDLHDPHWLPQSGAFSPEAQDELRGMLRLWWVGCERLRSIEGRTDEESADRRRTIYATQRILLAQLSADAFELLATQRRFVLDDQVVFHFVPCEEGSRLRCKLQAYSVFRL